MTVIEAIAIVLRKVVEEGSNLDSWDDFYGHQTEAWRKVEGVAEAWERENLKGKEKRDV